MENNFPRAPGLEGLTVGNLMTNNANEIKITDMTMGGAGSTKDLAPGTIGNWQRSEGNKIDIQNVKFGEPSPVTQASMVKDNLSQKDPTLEADIPNGINSCEVAQTNGTLVALEAMPKLVEAERLLNQAHNSASSINTVVDQIEAKNKTEYSPESRKGVASVGGTWTDTVYYTDDPINNEVEPTKIVDSALAFFKSVLGSDENITYVSILKNNLFSWFPICWHVWHEFVIIQTKNYCWSFEKNTKGILIQKVLIKDFNLLKSHCQGVKRMKLARFKKIRFHMVNTGDTVNDIFEWIYRNNYLNNHYNLLNENCQSFASLLYKSVMGKEGKRIITSLFYTEDADGSGEMKEMKRYDELSEWCESFAGDEQIVRIWIISQTKATNTTNSTGEQIWPIPKGIDMREFAIVETTNATRQLYWSFDKTPDGIFIQRGQNFDILEKKYRGMIRPGTIQNRGIEHATIDTKKTLQDILRWIRGEYFSNESKLANWKCNVDTFGSLLYDFPKQK